MDLTKTLSPFYSQINQLGLSIKDIVTPIELQPTLSMSRRKARKAYLINIGKTLSPDER